MSAQSAEQEFRDLSARLKWVIWTTYLATGIWTLSVITTTLQLTLMPPITPGHLSLGVILNFISVILQPLGTISIIVSFICFMMWMYRAAVNARALGANNLPTPALWGVLSKLIPLINLWTPFKAIRDIWKASQTPSEWQCAKIPFIFGVWWLSSIVFFVIFLSITITAFYAAISHSIFWLSILPLLVLLWLIAFNISFITSVSVAKRITRNQNELRSRIAFD